MKKKTIAIGVVIFFFAIVGYLTDKEEKKERAKPVLNVTNSEFTLNGQPAVTISFGDSEEDYCSVTVYRNSVVESYMVTSSSRENKDVAIDCNWSGKYFTESDSHETFVQFKLLSLDHQQRTAKATVSTKLVESKSDESFELKRINLAITGEFFDNLIKK